MKLILIVLSLSILFNFACKQSKDNVEVKKMTYTVSKVQLAPEINAEWDKEPWLSIPALSTKNYMGDKPEHFPKAQAKLAYDDQAIYVIFRVEDKYIRAVAKKYQDSVYKDSCVEFFFTPGLDIDKGYFNLEMNCGGNALFHHQKMGDRESMAITEQDFNKLTIAHSLPKIIDPEIESDTTWTLEYRLPFSILENYAQVTRPGTGVEWQANFYKCADACSHPHWLTWSHIDYPKPQFHLPQYFGTLRFE
jgi:hypothetical protein